MFLLVRLRLNEELRVPQDSPFAGRCHGDEPWSHLEAQAPRLPALFGLGDSFNSTCWANKDRQAPGEA